MCSRGRTSISPHWSARPDWKRLTPKGGPKGPHGSGAHPYPCAHGDVWMRLTTLRKEPGAPTAVACEGWRREGQSSRSTPGGVLCRSIRRLHRHSRGSRGGGGGPRGGGRGRGGARRGGGGRARGGAGAGRTGGRDHGAPSPVSGGSLTPRWSVVVRSIRRAIASADPESWAPDSRRPRRSYVTRTARQIGKVVPTETL